MDLVHIEYINMSDLVDLKKEWIQWYPDVSVYREEGFPFEEWDAFPGFYCSTSKTMEAFKKVWIDCGAYDPVEQIWSKEKMKIHLQK